ncbi:hypothetical protein [Streptomyces formicae]|uniref:hypothetical protein n=1 Tax=Streptomyces formicae TaxID=1616117 RepID=UPI001F56E704|nr:hypothetical protein [Streptomyces formicae]
MTDTGASHTGESEIITVGTPAEAARLAELLHDGPEAHFGRPPVTVVSYGARTAPVQRREAFREVYEAIVARIGEPTLYGGSTRGPSIRWRDGRRLVLLAGDRFGAGLSVHRPETLEDEEHRRFAWGGAWSAAEPQDVDLLPYSWQLYRSGPGERPAARPAAPLAGSWEHLERALGLMLAAWAEQLPVQVPGEWAGFTLVSGRDPLRQLVVSYSPDEGLAVAVDDRDAGQGPEHARQMWERGWHTHDRGWWQSAFPETHEASPAVTARLTVTELRTRGAVAPDELTAQDIGVNNRGELWLPGLGIRTP